MNVKYLLVLPLLALAAWISWTVAPQEKIIYRDKPVKQSDYMCGHKKIALHHKGYISYGSFASQVGTVIGYKEDGCEYIVQLDHDHLLDVGVGNFTEINQ